MSVHLRPRGGGIRQATTTVELFFDLVYVFAITQLSHVVLDDRAAAGRARRVCSWWLVGLDLHHMDGQLVRPGSAAVRAC